MKAVIFDLDGTLLDTLEDLYNAVNYALRESGYPERTLDEVRRFVGNGVRVLMELSVPEGTTEEDTEKALAIFRAYYGEHSNVNTRPYDGMPDVLQELKNHDIKMAIVSNKPDSAVKKLNEIYFADYMGAAIGESTGVKRKPAPDTVIKAAEELGVDLKDCIYVGDSDVDLATAKNSDIPCISVTWGFRDEKFLKEHKAKYFASTPNALVTEIFRLSKAAAPQLNKIKTGLKLLIIAELLAGAICIATILTTVSETGVIPFKSFGFIAGAFFSVFALKNAVVLLTVWKTTKA